MNLKHVEITPEVYEYVLRQRSGAQDEVLDALRAETADLGDISGMQISAEQGSFMTLLVAAIGTRNAIEVGTFTGYSSICIARGLAPGGKLLCFDQSAEWTGIARQYWARAGVADKIELRLGAARDTLGQLEPDATFDFAFIDADKTGYDAYYELILPHVRPNGLIVFDNMLRGGKVVAPNLTTPNEIAVDALNRKLAADERVEAVLVPLADGLQICRKK